MEDCKILRGLPLSYVVCFVSQEVTRMAKYTLEDIMYGDKYGIESAVVAEVFKMVQKGMLAKEIKEQLNTIYVKQALLVAKKMYDEGDCISDNEIQLPFNI